MESVAQYQQHGNAQQPSTMCEVFALRKAFGRAVLPLTIPTDNSGAMQGLDRGEVHRTSDNHTHMRMNETTSSKRLRTENEK